MSVIAVENAISSMLRPHAVVDTSRPIALQRRAERTAFFHYSKVKDWSAKTEPHVMQNNHRATRLRRLITFIVFGGALLSANPLMQSACAQNAAGPAAPAAAQPAAPVAAQPVAPPEAAPAPPAPPAALETAPSNQSAAPPMPANAAPPADQPIGQTSIGRTQLPQDLTPWGMFEDADRLVKGVLIGLAFASLVTWTVFVAKTFELRTARREVRDGLRILAGAATLAQANEQLRESTTPVAQLMQAAVREVRLSANARGDGLKERIAWQLERLEMANSRKISRGTGVLATVGSTAPFVGLFGTVWGIMNSFIGISNAHTTNLAVVAPGIAQALLATALGLAAAIPAVMIYNALARQTTHYRALLGDASALIMALVSRDLDRAKLPLAQAAE
jgi:biopolymer transport protein ExbB